MFRTKNTPVQITVPDYREPLSGIVTTAMAYGALVQYKTTGDARELIAAAGGRVAILEQDVLADADWQAHCKLDPRWHNEIRKPVPVGSCVSARFAKEAEFEGTDYFTGIDENSTPGTLLKVAAGKFAIADVNVPDAGQIVDIPQARLGRKITPHDSASFRWIVEFLE
jgi:hypothetical protein